MKRKPKEERAIVSETAEASKKARVKKQEREVKEKERNRFLKSENLNLVQKVDTLSANYALLQKNKESINSNEVRSQMLTENETLRSELEKYRFLATRLKEIMSLYNSVESDAKLTAALDTNVNYIMDKICEIATKSAKSRTISSPISESRRTERFIDWVFDAIQGNSTMGIKDHMWNLITNQDPFKLSQLRREIRFSQEEGWFRVDVFDIPGEPESLAKSWREANSPLNYMHPFLKFFKIQPITMILKNLASNVNFKELLSSKIFVRKVLNDSKNNVELIRLEAVQNSDFSASVEEMGPLEAEEIDPCKTFVLMFERRMKLNELYFPSVPSKDYRSITSEDAIAEIISYAQSPIIGLESEDNSSFIRAGIFRPGSRPNSCNLTYLARHNKKQSFHDFTASHFSFIDFFAGSFTESVLRTRFEFWLRSSLKQDLLRKNSAF